MSKDPIQISERELQRMTADLAEMHRESLPHLHRAVSEAQDAYRASDVTAITPTEPSRRGFLAGAGAALGGVVLAACSSGGSSKSSSSTTTSGGGSSGDAATDLKVSALATSLENLAVQVYQAGIDAATAGTLGAVPPAVVTFAQTAQQQHKDHAAAWNAILTGAGKPKVTGVDMTVKTGVTDPALAQVKNVGDLAKLALTLENVAAATYLGSIDVVKSKGGLQTSASIHPVELQHAAILNFVLGQYPVPDSFATTDGSRPLSDQIG